MKLLQKINSFFDKYVFNVKWKCNVCGKEIFSGEYFCAECEENLPFIKGAICDNCGRQTLMDVKYCSTCKIYAKSIDKGRSVFNYEKPIDLLIQKFKYSDGRYLAEVFASFLGNLYTKNNFDADYITFVPMSKKAFKKRGYNQSELLCQELSKKIGVEVFYGIEKVKETDRQATLKRKERVKNLKTAFRIKDKKKIVGKNVLIVDDVTTTGSTLDTISNKLKSAGAKYVYFLTVASVPPIDKY